MNSSKQEINLEQLYRQRKQSITAPDTIARLKAQQSAKNKAWSWQKIMTVLGLSGVMSFSIFALVSHFVDQNKTTKTNFSPTQVVTLVKLKPVKNPTEKNHENIAVKNTPLPPQPHKKQLPAQNNLTPETPKLTKVEPVALNLSTQVSVPEISTPKNHIKLIKKVLPKYPVKAQLSGQETRIKLAFTLNKQGRVENIELVNLSKDNSFSRAAKKALKQWQYQLPNTIEQQHLQQQNVVEFSFKLNKEKKSAK